MKRVLIVIDMQNDFIDGSLGTKEAQAIVSGVTEKIQTYDGEVIYTMDTHKEDYLETVEGKKLPVIHCIKGTNGWNIQKNIMEAIQYKSNQCFEKDTFGSIQLAQLMKEYYEHGLKEVELCGVCTDICVISNALLIKAFAPQLEIFVDASCCAGVTKESHENALEAMKMCHIQII